VRARSDRRFDRRVALSRLGLTLSALTTLGAAKLMAWLDPGARVFDARRGLACDGV